VRSVFFGSGEFALASFAALVKAGLPPVLLVTAPPRRRRRRGRAEPTPVHVAAAELGMATITPERVNAPEVLDRLRATRAELFAVSEYGQLLGRALLDVPAAGTINVHASLLPCHRGAAPVFAALLAGDRETGVTIQRVVQRLDAGPILAQERVPIGPGDDRGGLRARLAVLGGRMLVEIVRRYAAGDPPEGRPQEESAATHCRRLGPEDRRLHWQEDAKRLARRVRALSPRPGARATLLRDPKSSLVLLRAAAVPGSGTPGTVVAIGEDSFDIGCAEGLLRVEELVLAGRRAMSARAFLNGHRLAPGDCFG